MLAAILAAKQAIIGSRQDRLGLMGMHGQTEDPTIARDPMTRLTPRFTAVETEPNPCPNRADT
jgi:hypothetical protein